MKHTRKLRIMLAMLLSVFSISAANILAAPQANAVTCSGDNCTGKDPDATGCSADAITTAVYNHSRFQLQTRWSPTCKTNWARVVLFPVSIGTCVNAGNINAVQDTGYQVGATFPTTCSFNYEKTFWSPMIYSPVKHVMSTFYSPSFSGSVFQTPWS